MHLQPVTDIAAKPSHDSINIVLAAAALGLLANYLIWTRGLAGPGFAVWIVYSRLRLAGAGLPPGKLPWANHRYIACCCACIEHSVMTRGD